MGSKKPDFSNSPASNFFSDIAIEPLDAQPEAPAKDQHAPRVMGQGAQPDGDTAGKITAWTTTSGDGKSKHIIIEVPDGYEINAELLEKKTKRVQLLMQPSVYNYMKREADTYNISVNEAINRALREHMIKRG